MTKAHAHESIEQATSSHITAADVPNCNSTWREDLKAVIDIVCETRAGQYASFYVMSGVAKLVAINLKPRNPRLSHTLKQAAFALGTYGMPMLRMRAVYQIPLLEIAAPSPVGVAKVQRFLLP